MTTGSLSTPPPALSVFMPMRNAESTVARALRSILGSDMGDFEVVVVDDASTDASVAVVEAIGDSRVRLVRRTRHDFIAALNEGVRQCRGDFIARMDADDVSHVTRLGRQLAFLESTHLDGVGGAVRVVDEQGRRVASWRRYEAWLNAHRDPESLAAFRFVESPLANPTVMARREVFELGYRDGDWPEDYDFWLRAFARGFRFAKLNEVVLDWIDRPSRVTRSHPRYRPEAFDQCRRLHLADGPLRKAPMVDLWGAGQTGKPWLRWLLGTGRRVRRVFEVSPRKVGLFLHGIPIVAPETMSSPDGVPLVVAVGAEGAREQILDHILPRGYRPGHDTWFVA